MHPSSPHTCYMSHWSHYPLFHYSINIWWRVRSMTLLDKQFPTVYGHLVPPGPTRLRQHHIRPSSAYVPPSYKYKILYMNYGRFGDKCQKSQEWTSRDVCTLPFVRAVARQICCGLYRTGYCPPSQVIMNQGLQHIIHAYSYWLLT